MCALSLTFSLVDILYIPALLVFGIITSYQDIIHKRIKNKYNAAALVYSFLALSGISIYIKLRGDTINWAYLRLYLSNILLSLIFGFVLFLLGIWKAGDAKLFLAYSALIPLNVFTWGNIGFFPSYILIINAFTPPFCYYVLKILSKVKTSVILKELIQGLGLNKIIKAALYLFGVNWVIRVLMQLLNVPLQRITVLIFMLVIYYILNYANINIYKLGTVFTIMRLLFEFNNILDNFGWFSFLFQMILILGMGILMRLSIFVISKPIYIESLKPGMSLAEDIRTHKGKLIRIRDTSIFKTNPNPQAESIFFFFEKLSKKDVKKLQKLHSTGEFKDHIVFIKEDFPFAVLLFVGVCITLIFRGNFLVFLYMLIESFI